MKTIQLSLLSSLFLLIAQIGFAQTKTEKFAVAGECGMCKKKIETAAKNAGATYAVWNEDSKELTVKYKSTSTNKAKIEKQIADVGYDTKGFKAIDEAYNNLHECCKYDRSTLADKGETCCANGSCTKEACATCCKDGKCTADMACCKEGQSAIAMDCCKDGKCTKAEHAAHSAKDGNKTSCCKKA